MNRILMLTFLLFVALSNVLASTNQVAANIRLLGRYEKQKAADQTECFELCKDDEACVASSYRSLTRSCTLHDSKNMVMSKSGYTSFFKLSSGKSFALQFNFTLFEMNIFKKYSRQYG